MKKFFLYILCVSMLVSLVSCSDKKSDSKKKNKSTSTTIAEPYVDKYAYRSDPSITKAPEKDTVIGNGSKVSVGYDGSKGEGLFYSLYYVDDKGDVVNFGGSFFNDNKDGTFSREIVETNSLVDNKSGFMELSTVEMKKGKKAVSVSLGMYPVKFEINK